MAVKRFGAGLSFDFDSSWTVFSILGTVAGLEHSYFGNRIDIGVNNERAVAAVVLVIASIHLPIAVFGTPAIDTGAYSAERSRLLLVPLGWVRHAALQAHQRRENPPIHLQI